MNSFLFKKGKAVATFASLATLSRAKLERSLPIPQEETLYPRTLSPQAPVVKTLMLTPRFISNPVETD
jgi:hypothetical protein